MAVTRAEPETEVLTESQKSIALGELSVLISSPSGVRSVPLGAGGTLTVGRVAGCDVVLDDEAVTRKHAILRAGRSPTVEDLGSRNGTLVAGKRIASGERVPLGLGALVEIGNASLVLYRPRGGVVEPRATGGGGEASSIVVEDPSMKRLHAMLDVVGPSALPVLLFGETGTGKDVFARAVHDSSPRSTRPFAALNCAALPEQLLESELFGFERGAFTGATQAKPGLLESADGGTLFLDELGELPLTMQAKLLRVLESGEVRRLGSVTSKRIDVRVVAATNRDLLALVHANEFRADLFYRLNGFALTLPPLRDRPADILALAVRTAGTALSADVERALLGHDWPGNVRELRTTIGRALALARGGPIAPEHLMLPARGSRPPPSPPPPLATRPDGEDAERDRIAAALATTSGNQKEAAALLGISRRTIVNKIERYGLGRPRKSGR